jgi:hypothetical protein
VVNYGNPLFVKESSTCNVLYIIPNKNSRPFSKKQIKNT